MGSLRTKLLYLDDTYRFAATARVIACKGNGEKRATLVLDRTIFHPQGGGQPSDTGIIRAVDSSWTARVELCRLDVESGQVEHEVSFGEDTLPADITGSDVALSIDSEKRLLHARLHTAGHLLSHVIDELEIPLRGIKGYHFPAGPYVEYEATGQLDLSPTSIAKLRTDIERASNEMIQRAQGVSVTTCAPGSVNSEGLSEKAQKADRVRFIAVEGTEKARPCGGTHVANTAELGRMIVKKIGVKKGVIRICYLVD